jgi:hypothetical protein
MQKRLFQRAPFLRHLDALGEFACGSSNCRKDFERRDLLSASVDGSSAMCWDGQGSHRRERHPYICLNIYA